MVYNSQLEDEDFKVTVDNIYHLMVEALNINTLRANIDPMLDHMMLTDFQSPGTARNFLLSLNNAINFLNQTPCGITSSGHQFSYSDSSRMISKIRAKLNKSQNYKSSMMKTKAKLEQEKRWPKEGLLLIRKLVGQVKTTMNMICAKALREEFILNKEYLFTLR
jgi:hypothetical protein